MGSPSKKAILYFLRSIKSWFLGKSLNVFEPFPVAMTFTWGKPLLRSCWVLAIFGGPMGVTNKILPGIWFSSVFSYRFTTPQGQATFLHGFPQQQELWGTRWSWKLLWLVVSCLWSSSSSPLGKRFKRKSTGKSGWWKMKDVFSVRKLSSEPCNHCLLAWLLLPSIIPTCDIAIFIHKLDMGQNLRDGIMGCVDVIKPSFFLVTPMTQTMPWMLFPAQELNEQPMVPSGHVWGWKFMVHNTYPLVN